VVANDPFHRLPLVPAFSVTSGDISVGQQPAPPQMSGIFGVAGVMDTSPELENVGELGVQPDSTPA
jgi:hypothetical protein